MPSTRRRGTTNAFWNNASGIVQNNVSAQVQFGRNVDQVLIYVTTNGAATFSVQVAHAGDPDADGTIDNDTIPGVWHDLWYLNGAPAQAVITLAGAGSFALQIPDVVANWWRLKRTDAAAAVTVTAGWEAVGE